MGLYDTLFSHYSVACGQLLVTEADFQNDNRRRRFAESLRWLLEQGGVPVINENDVIARPELRKLFSDNDSLAVLIAQELSADVLLLLSDVHGVYARKPLSGEEPDLLPLFTRSTKVSFGDKSERGRGGMEAKVAAALNAAESGVGAVIIASGFMQESIERIMSGEVCAFGCMLCALCGPAAPRAATCLPLLLRSKRQCLFLLCALCRSLAPCSCGKQRRTRPLPPARARRARRKTRARLLGCSGSSHTTSALNFSRRWRARSRRTWRRSWPQTKRTWRPSPIRPSSRRR